MGVENTAFRNLRQSLNNMQNPPTFSLYTANNTIREEEGLQISNIHARESDLVARARFYIAYKGRRA